MNIRDVHRLFAMNAFVIEQQIYMGNATAYVGVIAFDQYTPFYTSYTMSLKTF